MIICALCNAENLEGVLLFRREGSTCPADQLAMTHPQEVDRSHIEDEGPFAILLFDELPDAVLVAVGG